MNPEPVPHLSQIKVEKLRLRAYIGFVKWETEKLQDLVISFSFKFDSSASTKSDDVTHSVDYKAITKKVIALVDNSSFNLIETVAERIYELIVSQSALIQDVGVCVEKPHALRFADNVMVKIDGSDRYNCAIVALGSNIDAEVNFDKAMIHLGRVGTIVSRTEFITTAPLKYKDQADFLNGAVLLYTRKSLSELKLELRQIEAIMGRVRTVNKSAPRKIDLDVLTYNNFLIDKDIDQLPFLIDFVKYLQPGII
jgi:2-amino-4-hydroxy-6-hydroxymethyldihydropteridine diphosphokinase